MNDNELYHYGIPGMKWGKRKAKYEYAADSYRKAAGTANNKQQANKYLSKANKLEKKASALDTRKGRIAYNAKKGAAITAGILGSMGALYVSNFKGWQMGKQTAINTIKSSISNTSSQEFMAKLFR